MNIVEIGNACGGDVKNVPPEVDSAKTSGVPAVVILPFLTLSLSEKNSCLASPHARATVGVSFGIITSWRYQKEGVLGLKRRVGMARRQILVLISRGNLGNL